MPRRARPHVPFLTLALATAASLSAAGLQPLSPCRLQAGGIKGQDLMVGIFQHTGDEVFQTRGATPKDCNEVILQIALDVHAAAKAVPESILKTHPRCPKNIDLKVGTLLLK